MGILISQVGNFDYTPSDIYLRFQDGETILEFTVPPGETLAIDWGDNTGLSNILPGDYTIANMTEVRQTYSGAPPEGFTARLMGHISYLKVTNNLVEVVSFGSDPSLTSCILNSNVLTTVPPDISPYFSQLTLQGCSALNDPNLSTWTTTGLTTMQNMFSGCTSLNQNLDSWDVSNVTTMQSMFQSCTNFNQPLNSWDLSNLIGTGLARMFQFCTNFNQPLDNWGTSSIQHFFSVFQGCAAFNQDISAWDVSAGTNFSGCFRDAIAFNQPLNAWNTMNATSFFSMFNGALAFNQPLDSWDTSHVTNMSSMFNNASAFTPDLSGWCVSLIATQPSNFAGGTAGAFTPPVWGTCP